MVGDLNETKDLAMEGGHEVVDEMLGDGLDVVVSMRFGDMEGGMDRWVDR